MKIIAVILSLYYLSNSTFILTSVEHNTTIQKCIHDYGGINICLAKYKINSQFNQGTGNSSQKYHVDCHFVGSWCPGKYLSSCVPVEYDVSEPNGKTGDKYAMVSFCSTQNKTASRKSCFLPIDQNNIWHQVPVFSRHTKVTYASKQCSECHGEEDIIPWSIGVSCPSVIDLNTYSVTSALWEDLKRQNCSIYFTPPRNSNLIPCNISLTTQQNVAGKQEDLELGNVGKSSRNQYGYYRRVFCNLCITEARQRELNLSQLDENILHRNCNMHTCIEIDSKLDTFADSETVLSEERRNCLTYGCTFPSWDIVSNFNNVYNERPADNSSHYVAHVNFTSLCVENEEYETWCENKIYVTRLQNNLNSHSYRELFSILDMSAEGNERFSPECKLAEIYDPYQVSLEHHLLV